MPYVCIFFVISDDENETIHCRVNGVIIQRHNTTIQQECNTCTCNRGRRTCTKVLCSPHNCWNRTDVDACPSGGICMPKSAECLKPPCPKWAECSGPTTSQSQSGDGGIPEDRCFPNTTELSGDCAKIHIVFNMKKLPKVGLKSFARFVKINQLRCRYEIPRLWHYGKP